MGNCHIGRGQTTNYHISKPHRSAIKPPSAFGEARLPASVGVVWTGSPVAPVCANGSHPLKGLHSNPAHWQPDYIQQQTFLSSDIQEHSWISQLAQLGRG